MGVHVGCGPVAALKALHPKHQRRHLRKTRVGGENDTFSLLVWSGEAACLGSKKQLWIS